MHATFSTFEWATDRPAHVFTITRRRDYAPDPVGQGSGRLGKGAQGAVLRLGERGADGVVRPVAVKIIEKDVHERVAAAVASLSSAALFQRRGLVKDASGDMYDAAVPADILQELGVLRMLHHPNVVPLRNIILRDTRVMLTFPAADRSLWQMISDKPARVIPTALRCQVMYQLLTAIAYLHSQNVVHRDIKPDNVVLYDSPFGADAGVVLVQLVDLGLSKPFFAPHAHIALLTGESVTTPWYRAPEVFQEDSHYSTKIDLWSAGVTMAQLLWHAGSGFELEEWHMKLPAAGIVGHLRRAVARRTQQANTTDANGQLVSRPEAELLKSLLAMDPDDRVSAFQARQATYFDTVRGRLDALLYRRDSGVAPLSEVDCARGELVRSRHQFAPQPPAGELQQLGHVHAAYRFIQWSLEMHNVQPAAMAAMMTLTTEKLDTLLAEVWLAADLWLRSSVVQKEPADADTHMLACLLTASEYTTDQYAGITAATMSSLTNVVGRVETGDIVLEQRRVLRSLEADIDRVTPPQFLFAWDGSQESKHVAAEDAEEAEEKEVHSTLQLHFYPDGATKKRPHDSRTSPADHTTKKKRARLDEQLQAVVSLAKCCALGSVLNRDLVAHQPPFDTALACYALAGLALGLGTQAAPLLPCLVEPVDTVALNAHITDLAHHLKTIYHALPLWHQVMQPVQEAQLLTVLDQL
jgi:serine/threonine protein kinase